MSEAEDLSPRAEQLLASERNVACTASTDADAVWERLATTLAFGAGSPPVVDARPSNATHAVSSAPLLAAAKISLVFLAGVAAGVVGRDLVAGDPSASSGEFSPAQTRIEPPSDAGLARDAGAVDSGTDARMEATANERRGVAAPPMRSSSLDAGSSVAMALDASLERERLLLGRARAALERARPEDAIVALDAHAREFPAGRLGEERDLLRIQAMVFTGRREEARQLADEFMRKFPQSIFIPTLRSFVVGH